MSDEKLSVYFLAALALVVPLMTFVLSRIPSRAERTAAILAESRVQARDCFAFLYPGVSPIRFAIGTLDLAAWADRDHIYLPGEDKHTFFDREWDRVYGSQVCHRQSISPLNSPP